MIYLTGDTHGNFIRLHEDSFYEQKEMTKDDYLIIAGDFGGIWAQEEHNGEKMELDWLESLTFTTLFVDGNHENFNRLNNYPVKEWHGGKVHEIRPSVLHLMRGEVFEIDGKKFFTFGGASSHDIQDGILDPDDFCDEYDFRRTYNKWWNEGKVFRVKGLSWWPEELPSKDEMQNGLNNLEKHNWKVDFVVTHSPSASIIALLGSGLYEQDILTRYLEEIRVKLDYKRWIAGHMHVCQQVNANDILLYEQIIRIA